VFPSSRFHHRRYAVALASVVGVLIIPSGPMAQPVGDPEASFEARFSIDGRVAPIFTRPEVIELLSGVSSSAPSLDSIATAEPAADEAHGSEPSRAIIMAEPKGPAKVLMDLLATPIQDLLVSPAEAGPDVASLPAAQDPARPADPPTETASVPVRAADPLAERPAVEGIATMPAPGSAPELTPAEEIAAAATGEPRSEQPSPSPQQAQTGVNAKQARRIGAGRAAWYQHPGRTASGETFNPNRLTAAHARLPFGARVRVVNEETHRAVVVSINDRIPRKAQARIVIDLSRASAKSIGLAGVARVSLYELDGPINTAMSGPAQIALETRSAGEPERR
jgi:rare lipoprotein A